MRKVIKKSYKVTTLKCPNWKQHDAEDAAKNKSFALDAQRASRAFHAFDDDSRRRRYCPRCGSRLVKVKGTVTFDGYAVCSRCSKPVYPSEQFCVGCGEKL